MRWFRQPTEAEQAVIGDRIKAVVIQQKPQFSNTKFGPETWVSIYTLGECLICGRPRYAHHGRARRHLAEKGGTG